MFNCFQICMIREIPEWNLSEYSSYSNSNSLRLVSVISYKDCWAQVPALGGLIHHICQNANSIFDIDSNVDCFVVSKIGLYGSAMPKNFFI